MKWSRAFSASMSSALLLPFLAVGDSQVRAGATGKALSATAHVDFKIVIPTVLALDVDAARREGAHANVSVMSNSRSVSLGAATRAFADGRNNVILNVAARKVISQQAACRARPSPVTSPSSAPSLADAEPNRTICTASMP